MVLTMKYFCTCQSILALFSSVQFALIPCFFLFLLLALGECSRHLCKYLLIEIYHAKSIPSAGHCLAGAFYPTLLVRIENSAL